MPLRPDREPDQNHRHHHNRDRARRVPTLTGLGSFGGRKPRAVWIGTLAPEALEPLQLAHEMAAKKAGLKPESRNFIPHVTLARLRNTSSEATARYLEAHGAITLPSFTVNRTVLFSSRPGSGGGPYRVEMSYPCNLAYSEVQSGEL